jgi:hypothetical protein
VTSSGRVRAMKKRRDAQLVEIDGRMVAVEAPHHGDRNIYNGWLCRCVPCTEANRVWCAEDRRRRANQQRSARAA